MGLDVSQCASSRWHCHISQSLAISSGCAPPAPPWLGSPVVLTLGLFTSPFMIMLQISEMLSLEKGGIQLIQKNYGKAPPCQTTIWAPGYIFAFAVIWNGLEEWTEGKQSACAETTILLQKHNVMVYWVQMRTANIIYEVFQSGKETAAAQPWPGLWLDDGRRAALSFCLSSRSGYL